MTNRPKDMSFNDCYSQPESRLSQQIRTDSTDEGCPVIESGTVCGETDNLNIFQEFREIYNDCLKKLEDFPDDSGSLRRLAPFRKLVEDLWEQNAALIEAVEELELEATNTVSNLQSKLKRSCQKMSEYKEDIKSLVEIIKRHSANSTIDFRGIKFKTVNPSAIWRDIECSVPKCPKTFEEHKLKSIDESSEDESCEYFNSYLPTNYVEPKQKQRVKNPCENYVDYNDKAYSNYRPERLRSSKPSKLDYCYNESRGLSEIDPEAGHYSREFHAEENCYNCLKIADTYSSNKCQEPLKQIHFHINMGSEANSETNSCCNCDYNDEN